jgi:hypothetical protein
MIGEESLTGGASYASAPSQAIVSGRKHLCGHIVRSSVAVGRAFALLTKTYHGSRVTGHVKSVFPNRWGPRGLAAQCLVGSSCCPESHRDVIGRSICVGAPAARSVGVSVLACVYAPHREARDKAEERGREISSRQKRGMVKRSLCASRPPRRSEAGRKSVGLLRSK